MPGTTLDSQTLKSGHESNAETPTLELTAQVHLLPKSQNGINALAPTFKPISDAGPSGVDTTHTEVVPFVNQISNDVLSSELTR
jgi:hypothetical protein